MNHRTLLSAIPLFIAATSGCLDGPICSDDEVIVYGNSGQGFCMHPTHGYTSSTPPPPTAPTHAPSSPSQTATPVATTDGADASTPGSAAPDSSTSPPSSGDACGAHGAQGDSVRVVDKSDPVPALNDVAPNVADGTYSLVQATFFRTGQAASAVRSVRAALEVHGPTLALSAQDTSLTGLPSESLSLLVGSGAVTKTCESVHGTVAAWFFPFAVGGSAVTHMEYDGAGGFLRIIVARADGATELVFAK